MQYTRTDTSMGSFDVALDVLRQFRSRRVLLLSPEKPDADSIGCMIAFKRFLAWLRPEVECIMWAPEKPKPNTLWKVLQPFCNPMTEIATEFPEGYVPDVCVAFDYGNFWRLHLDHWKEKVFFVGFDHHGTDTGFPTYGIEVIGNGAPSATTVLLWFFQSCRFPIDADTAKALLVGLIADTGHFTNALATREAFTTAAELMCLGADWQEVLRLSRPRTSRAAFIAQSEVRTRVVFDDIAGLAFLFFSQEDLKRWGVTGSDVLPLLGVLQGVEGVKIVVVYHEEEGTGEWYGQIRIPRGSDISARGIAEHFVSKGGARGGGNHGAAGFKSSSSPIFVFEALTNLLHMQMML